MTSASQGSLNDQAARRLDAPFLDPSITNQQWCWPRCQNGIYAETHSPLECAMSPDPQTLPPEVLNAIARGHMVEAIKLVRQQRQCDLKTAKDAVDAYRAAHPELQPKKASGEGHAWGWLLLVVLVLAAGVYFSR